MIEDRNHPVEMTRSGEHDLAVLWKDGHRSVFPARVLRMACPCADCVDEITGAPLLDAAKLPEDVHPVKIVAVGHYAVQISFSDGHGSGIYTYELLRKLDPQAPQAGV